MVIDNSIIIPIKNRSSLKFGNKFLTLFPNLVKSIIDTKQESIEIIVIDFASTDTDYNWLRSYPVRSLIVTMHEAFNLGRGRNVGRTYAKGKRLFFLDADMSLPVGFFKALIPIVDAGITVFPVYDILDVKGEVWRLGSGWGNVCLLAKTFDSLSISWPERTRYGGEDTAVANVFVKENKGQYARIGVPGFVHQYHDKNPKENDWYKKEEKVKCKKTQST